MLLSVKCKRGTRECAATASFHKISFETPYYSAWLESVLLAFSCCFSTKIIVDFEKIKMSK